MHGGDQRHKKHQEIHSRWSLATATRQDDQHSNFGQSGVATPKQMAYFDHR